MTTFSTRLEGLSNIDWSGNYLKVITESMDDIINHPYDFAAYLEEVVYENKDELFEQVKGILFFLVYRNPEIFILIYMYFKNFGKANKELMGMLEAYNYLIIES